MTETLLLYRNASTEGATHLDLILAVYDALARDLTRIANAISVSDIEGRCRQSHHALLLLGYLESWVERLHEPTLERSLTAFYSMLRTEIQRLQASRAGEPFRDLALLVCETRAAWQQKSQPTREVPSTTQTKNGSYAGGMQVCETSLGWSA